MNIRAFTTCLRPSATELKRRLWAVYASDHLWPDGIVKPFVKRLGETVKSDSLSFTCNFALGGLCPQLASIYPYDSFIHGAWEINSKAILVVAINAVIATNFDRESSGTRGLLLRNPPTSPYIGV